MYCVRGGNSAGGRGKDDRVYATRGCTSVTILTYLLPHPPPCMRVSAFVQGVRTRHCFVDPVITDFSDGSATSGGNSSDETELPVSPERKALVF